MSAAKSLELDGNRKRATYGRLVRVCSRKIAPVHLDLAINRKLAAVKRLKLGCAEGGRSQCMAVEAVQHRSERPLRPSYRALVLTQDHADSTTRLAFMFFSFDALRKRGLSDET